MCTYIYIYIYVSIYIQVNLNRKQGLFSFNNLPNDSSIRKTFIMDKKKQNNSFETKKYSNNNFINSKGSQKKKELYILQNNG